MRQQQLSPLKRRASATQVAVAPELDELDEIDDSYYPTRMPSSARRYQTTKVYDNDSYIFGPFVPLMHLLLSNVTLPLQRVSSGERLSFYASSLVSSSALPKSLVRETSPGVFSSGWEDRIRAVVTAVPSRAGNVQSG